MPVYKAYDPIPAFTFHVAIAGREIGFFTECTGISFERDVVEHKEGGVNDFVHMLPGRGKRGTVTLKRGVDPDLELLDWYAIGALNGRMPRDPVAIVIRDRAREIIARFDLVDAFPTEYSGPTLRADDVAPAVETLTIAHGGQSGTGGGGGGGGGDDDDDTAKAAAAVNINALANEVYALLKKTAWLERERLPQR